jgi:hypothetical protein
MMPSTALQWMYRSTSAIDRSLRSMHEHEACPFPRPRALPANMRLMQQPTAAITSIPHLYLAPSITHLSFTPWRALEPARYGKRDRVSQTSAQACPGTGHVGSCQCSRAQQLSNAPAPAPAILNRAWRQSGLTTGPGSGSQSSLLIRLRPSGTQPLAALLVTVQRAHRHGHQ